VNWSVRAENLRVATIAAVDKLSAELEGQGLYGICLQTADDGMSVGFCANTEEGYAKKRAAEAKVEDITPDYAAYLRWAPAEWRYESFGDGYFAEVNRDLTAASLGSSADPILHSDRLIDAMIDALAHLRVERAQLLAGVMLFVTISDSEAAPAVERRSVHRLNPPALAGKFGLPSG